MMNKDFEQTRKKKKMEREGDDDDDDDNNNNNNINNDDDDNNDNDRNWVDDLPDLVLDCILSRLSFSVPDLFAFFTICKSRRRCSLACRSMPPPLLLCCNKPLQSLPFRYHEPLPLSYRPPSSHRLKYSWMSQLKSPAPDPRPFKSMVSPTTLSKTCVGYSHGHLIFASPRKTLLANVFTGNEISPPLLPHNYACASAILTATPSSSSCSTLVLAASRRRRYRPPFEHGGYDILCWGVGTDDDWSILKPDIGANLQITSMLVFNGQVLCLLSDASLLALDFDFRVHMMDLKHVQVQLPSDNDLAISTRGGGTGNMQRLVECGGELLMVNAPRSSSNRIKIFRWVLDSSANNNASLSSLVWVEVESIGDWCLFLNTIGECPPACSNPTVWGGKSNCIYIPAYDCRTWRAHPLDGTEFYPSFLPPCRWPTPVWVYPSMLL